MPASIHLIVCCRTDGALLHDDPNTADAATFHGSDARDVFVANNRMSKLRGGGFYNRAGRVFCLGGVGRRT